MRSTFEEKVAADLVHRGVSFEYEEESFEYWLPVYKAECGECFSSTVFKKHWYTPDFFLSSGVVVESKGRFTAKDRKIAKAMKEYHPEIDLRYLFMSDNKLSKNSKSRYSDWCEQFGLEYAFREVPEEWV